MKDICSKTLLVLCCFLSLACSQPKPGEELHRAASSARLERLTTLLDEGADINKVVNGETPLLVAARKNQDKALVLLLERGASVEVKDTKGRDVWELVDSDPKTALSSYQARCMVALMEHGFADRIDLIEAAKRADSAELVVGLIDKGEGLKAMDDNGWTALHHAANQGHEGSCEALIKAGADVNAESTKEWSQVTGLEVGERVDFRFQVGSRPLDVAEYGGSRGTTSCRQQLEEAGATANPGVDNVLFH